MFSFPLDKDKRLAWYDAVQLDLPVDVTVDKLNNKFICDAHFEPFMWATSGNGRKRLFGNAVPHRVMERLIELPVIEPEPKTRSVATQVQFLERKIEVVNFINHPPQINSIALYQREISNLKRRCSQLASRNEKLRTNPPASLIYKNRYKLSEYVTDEAWMLFDCAMQNSSRTTHGHRHSLEVKKWTQTLAQKNRAAFKMLKPIFNLPSLRTIGRLDAELANIAANQTMSTNNDDNINDDIISESDGNHMEENISDNLQMDQSTPQAENAAIQAIQLGNITYVDIPYTI